MKFYIISPPKINKNFNHQNFDKITDIIKVNFFQFRPKYSSMLKRLKFVESYYNKISEICKKKKIKMIINDDFEIAERFRFDGIHLGQDDKSCHDAKMKFGEDFIVGVSCSDSQILYNKAIDQKADYVAFGPLFKTFSKIKKRTINIESLFVSFEKLRLPFTLIGGINHSNFMQLLKYKPLNIAIINSIWNYEKGPIESASLFNNMLKESKND
tara:strand:+ start:76 stop:714 length:639 start_codon:yes stop_codon:yes gene_type:complete